MADLDGAVMAAMRREAFREMRESCRHGLRYHQIELEIAYLFGPPEEVEFHRGLIATYRATIDSWTRSIGDEAQQQPEGC